MNEVYEQLMLGLCKVMMATIPVLNTDPHRGCRDFDDNSVIDAEFHEITDSGGDTTNDI